MKKKKQKTRVVCSFCGSKRYIEKMCPFSHKGVVKFQCANNDLCVLKMSYNKKKKKL